RGLAWGFVDKVVVRDLDSAHELAVSVEGALRGFLFSPDGSRLLIASTRSTALWEAATGRAIWSVPSDVPEDVDVGWSSDARAILLRYGWAALEVLEATSGERLAWFETLGPPVTPVRASIWQRDLRTQSVVSATGWEIRPVPPPDESPPDESLTRTLQRTGLAFRGVDLGAAP